MLRFCAGWKGWTSKQALAEDLNYIYAAQIGHIEMLQAVFGKPDKSQVPPSQRPPTAEPVPADGFIHPVADAPELTSDIFDDLFGSAKGNG